MNLRLRRRTLLGGSVAAAAVWRAGLAPDTRAALAALARRAEHVEPPLDPRSQATLEAFCDTMIPGEKRYPGDRAVAGAAEGPGAVQAGAIALLTMPEVDVAPLLPALAGLLDAEAVAWAVEHGRLLDPTVPPFVALRFGERTQLCARLLAVRAGPLDSQDPERLPPTLVALLAFVAFHCAGHRHTVSAVDRGHSGLRWLRFPFPSPDGLWRYPRFSYRRRLARRHPATTSSGSPA